MPSGSGTRVGLEPPLEVLEVLQVLGGRLACPAGYTLARVPGGLLSSRHQQTQLVAAVEDLWFSPGAHRRWLDVRRLILYCGPRGPRSKGPPAGVGQPTQSHTWTNHSCSLMLAPHYGYKVLPYRQTY